MCPVCAALWVVAAGGVVYAVMAPSHRTEGIVIAAGALLTGAALHAARGM